MENPATINWYPGHMKKTRELIATNLKLVSAVLEVIDARIPESGRNPIISELCGEKKRIIVLNKSDLADEEVNALWLEKFRGEFRYAVTTNAESGEGCARLMSLLENLRDEMNEGRARKRDLRLMVLGIPNVGKSSLINRLAGRKSAKTGGKPGVTRGKQWINLGENIMLLDMPGILWPKFEDPKAGAHLAFCGSIKDEILDLATLGLNLTEFLAREYPQLLCERYKLDSLEPEALANMENIAKKRAFLMSGGRIDYERTARTLLDEFRSGRIGRISLEKP